MNKLSIILIVVLSLFLLFVLTRKLPPTPVYNLCSSNNDCQEGYNCSETKLCMYNGLTDLVKTSIDSSSALNTSLNNVYTAVMQYQLMAGDDQSFPNLLSTLMSNITFSKKLSNLANLMYANGQVSISGAVNYVNNGQGIVDQVNASQSTLESITSSYPDVDTTNVINLMTYAVSSANAAQAAVNNLSNYLFSGY